MASLTARKFDDATGADDAVERSGELHQTGLTLAAIARSLNEEGVPPPRGGRWHSPGAKGALSSSGITPNGVMSALFTGANARRRAREVVLLAVAAVCSWLLATQLASSPDTDVAVIASLVIMGTKHFRHKKQEGENEPKHPAVKFVLAAWNEGDFGEAEKYVAPDLAMSMNGFAYDSSPEDDGPAIVQESIEYWRAIVPDLKMDLSQEIREKDRIAIEWLVTGTHTGERPELPASGNVIELQGSAFLTLEDDKIVEVSTVFDALALAVQTDAAQPPAWWPGRSAQ
jgi:steroid delta-isomerase-like uncharacterized protein